MSRAVVIGAGLGGLATAARLAAAGHHVTVFEAAPTVGGKLGVFERDGFGFDTGPSLLTLPAVLEQLFGDTGGPAELQLTAVDPACAYVFADGTELVLPHDADRVRAALDAALGEGAGESWRRLHDHSRRLWELVGEPILRQPISLTSLARMSIRPADLRAVAPWRTIDGLGRRMLPDARLRTWLNRYATYSGSDPRRTPAVLAVTSFVEQEFGAWYVPGGLRRIVDAIAARCGDLGVEIHTGAAVEQVLVRDGRAVGVRVGGRDVPADVVVSNADAAVLHDRLLPAGTASRARRRMRRSSRSMAGFVLLLGLSGHQPGASHRVYFPADYDAEFDAIFGRHPSPVADPTIYVHAPDDPALRPDDDTEGWFVLVNAPSHDPGRGVDWDDPGLRERYARHVLDVLARRGADVRDRILFTETLTPADLQRRTGAPGGAIYGTASHGPRAALRRPANRGPLPGLYLVGGSAHPGGGIPLVLMSAEIVARLIGAAGTAAASTAPPREAADPSPPRRRPST
ncbi:phytoene desaturase [Mycobacterium antarcticum]|uniref:phytoene desaturase family protein n=1 Tax=unclassified Mycolicibacterium TaxID=2636767 RepID=UPI00238867EB|nr:MULTISPECIES: phytoene desaturase family protein [unclassified Mycolicibacterium]BDX35080.1 phytoene desaturase [Mycolicibacterium sp. TUM20985]GLP81359.1 phytoene desaturase [Mycolicibacterium sp. TUM20984]